MLCLLLPWVEGVASYCLFASDWLAAGEAPIDGRHVEYDETLGWDHLPGVHLPDRYGPGKALTLDDRGARVTGPTQVEEGPSVRILCSGDSFTFGPGVGDDETWVARLDAQPGIVAINKGRNGYGIGQIYLSYDRDADAIDHDVHIVAVFADDFRRMQFDRFFGRGKPVVQLRDGQLVTENVPVPRIDDGGAWHRRQHALRGLRLHRLATRVRGEAERPAEESVPPRQSMPQAIRVAEACVLALHERHAREGRTFVFVFLPTRLDDRPSAVDPLRTAFIDQLRVAGVSVIDVVEALRGPTAPPARSLFFPYDGSVAPDVAGHPTAAGHRFIAECIAAEVRNQ